MLQLVFSPTNKMCFICRYKSTLHMKGEEIFDLLLLNVRYLLLVIFFLAYSFFTYVFSFVLCFLFFLFVCLLVCLSVLHICSTFYLVSGAGNGSNLQLERMQDIQNKTLSSFFYVPYIQHKHARKT